jgi:hypothetical protein
MTCPFCGWYVAPGSAQCRNCRAVTPGHVMAPGGWTSRAESKSKRIAQIALAVLVVAIVGAYSVSHRAASADPTPSPSPVAAIPTRTTAPTPVPTPNLAPLTFGALSYTTAGCWTQIHDEQGHLIGGAELDVSVVATNTGTVASDPVWLIVQPTNVMGPDLTWLASSPLKGTMMIGPGVAFQGPPIAPGKSSTLKAAVFYQGSFRADYSVEASVARAGASISDIDAGSAGRWSGLWASVSIC